MIEVTLGVDDVAATRFTSCAVNETVASLRVLRHPHLHTLHAARLRARVPLALTFDLELLMALMEPAKWIPAILAPTPSAKPADPLTQLNAVAHSDIATAEDDLLILRQHSARWVAMTAQRLMEEVSAALAGYWRQVLEPIWERVRIITEADIAHRSATLAADGVAAAIAGLHDQIRYVDHRLLIDLPGHSSVNASTGQGMWLVPSIFRWPRIAVVADHGITKISYGCRGAALLWEQEPTTRPDSLSALLGRTRALILESTGIPATTSSLSAQLSLTPATISEHLSVLTAAGLLSSRRQGRRVLYTRTALGTTLANRQFRSQREQTV
jgi:DNA-binding transcriptional ArsR family regulator